MDRVPLIELLARKFRLAIEKTGNSLFNNFPFGCCGEASKLLQKYLSTNCIETVYVWGRWGEQSHGWLEHDSLIIDITADQFPDIFENVIVTYDRSWHTKFKYQDKYIVDFEKFESMPRERFRAKYNTIVKEISSSSAMCN